MWMDVSAFDEVSSSQKVEVSAAPESRHRSLSARATSTTAIMAARTSSVTVDERCVRMTMTLMSMAMVGVRVGVGVRVDQRWSDAAIEPKPTSDWVAAARSCWWKKSFHQGSHPYLLTQAGRW